LRHAVDEARQEILAGSEALCEAVAIVGRARERLEALLLPALPSAINATGVVLHTGLGRAPLSDEAIRAIVAAAGAAPLEVDLETGDRGDRQRHCRDLLCLLTGAEAALVVNNNAAACLLTLDALAVGREVVVSRGHLVEIGGAFRMPEIIAKSGARLVEVGTTNRTALRDYGAAIGENTAAILEVHTSNYRIRGFTEHPALPDLARLAHERGFPLLFDAGSGALFDLAGLGMPDEPVIDDAISAGCDLVCFSGDKLLGGPQAGIVVGRKALVDRLARDPLARAVRADKLALAALHATLQAHIRPHPGVPAVPALERIAESLPAIRERAAGVAAALASVTGLAAEVVECASQAGSGSLPDQEIPSAGVALRVDGLSPSRLARALREGCPPVFARIVHDAVLLDLRTVPSAQVEGLVDALRNLVAEA